MILIIHHAIRDLKNNAIPSGLGPGISGLILY